MTDHIPFLSYIISACIGIGLAAATGFRVFLPIFIISLSSYFNWIPIAENWEWLASLPTLIISAVAMLIEVLSFYIPFLDNVLDSISIPLATIAGSALFALQFTDMQDIPQWALSIIAGGGTAALIGTSFAGTRAASSATTGGLGNPVVSTVETTGSIVMTILTIIAPILALVVVILIVWLILRYGKKLWNRLFMKKKSIA
ncbi:DUF4126 domain-containing protein [Sphingobacterium sp. SRCM116780]|uniref:DUF4126 domain-containing protein n=1 Tax=Sphingobacterium sp. SRCM116780 TaxID=2907623 RepID=UPI001F414EA1|nr:DUF4126 domain-containing protein [Sphingobacterium sp. SRCM116780]UIR57916.1 DUF4126 domain-containing protein [Sphingobacterium sp. SRCM116780]